MAVETEVAALVAGLDAKARRRDRLQRFIDRLMGRHRAYRALFFDGDGNLKPEALTVLKDLGRVANFGKVDPGASDTELRMNEGRRHLLLHIFDRFEMDAARLARLAQKLKETE